MKRYIIIGPFLLVLFWSILGQFNFIDSFFLPSPFVVIKNMLSFFYTGIIFPDLCATLKRVLIAFSIGCCIGLPLGLYVGRSEKIYRSIEFVIDFFRSIPATALSPLFLLLFGITDVSKIAVAAFATTLIVLFNTAHGVLHAHTSRIAAARIMGATETQIFKWILFWESLPQTFVGMRSAVSMSLMVIIVTEMFIGTAVGLGKRIIDSQITYDIPSMYATILLSGVVGYLLNFIFVICERRLLHWTKRLG